MGGSGNQGRHSFLHLPCQLRLVPLPVQRIPPHARLQYRHNRRHAPHLLQAERALLRPEGHSASRARPFPLLHPVQQGADAASQLAGPGLQRALLPVGLLLPGAGIPVYQFLSAHHPRPSVLCPGEPRRQHGLAHCAHEFFGPLHHVGLQLHDTQRQYGR